MNMKSTAVRKFLAFTHSWNHEIHKHIENKIVNSFAETFPDGVESPAEQDRIIKGMRDFYYQRMMTTATLLLAFSSLVVSLVALVVSIISIFR